MKALVAAAFILGTLACAKDPTPSSTFYYDFGKGRSSSVPGIQSPSSSPYFSSRDANERARQDALRKSLYEDLARANTPQLPRIQSPAFNESSLQRQWVENFREKWVQGPGSKPLKEEFPKLAEAIRDHDARAMADGLEDYGKQMLFRSYSAEQKEVLADRVTGTLVDDQGVILGLPNAPRPIDLISPWSTSAGYRVRNSLNRLMVVKQFAESDFQKACGPKGEKACEKEAAAIKTFRSRYLELTLLHAIADQMGVRKNSAFDAFMTSLDATVRTAEAFLFETDIMVNEFVLGVGALAQTFVSGNLGVVVCESLLHIDVIAKQAWVSLGQRWDRFLNGTPEEKGAATARFLGDALSLMGGPAAVKNLSVNLGLKQGTQLASVFQKGPFPLLEIAGNRVLETVATEQKILSRQAAGAIGARTAKELGALVKDFPQSAGFALESESFAGVFGKLESALPSKSRSLLASSDSAVAELAKRDLAGAKDLITDLSKTANVLKEAPPGRLKQLLEESKDIVVQTSRGPVTQSPSPAALQLRADILDGRRIVYRRGEYGITKTNKGAGPLDAVPTDWSSENPLLTLDFEKRHGIYSSKFDFLEIGILDPKSPFVVRVSGPGAPIPGKPHIVHPGGALEIVVPPGGVKSTKHIAVD